MDYRMIIDENEKKDLESVLGEGAAEWLFQDSGAGGMIEGDRVYTMEGVYLKDDDSTYLLPDLTVICDPEKIEDDGCHGAPDWVIEVTSPSTGKRDYGKKLFMYRSAGVREYWVIDPVHRTVMVYLFGKEEEGAVYRFEDEIPCSIYPDLKIRLADTV